MVFKLITQNSVDYLQETSKLRTVEIENESSGELFLQLFTKNDAYL